MSWSILKAATDFVARSGFGFLDCARADCRAFRLATSDGAQAIGRRTHHVPGRSPAAAERWRPRCPPRSDRTGSGSTSSRCNRLLLAGTSDSGRSSIPSALLSKDRSSAWASWTRPRRRVSGSSAACRSAVSRGEFSFLGVQLVESRQRPSRHRAEYESVAADLFAQFNERSQTRAGSVCLRTIGGNFLWKSASRGAV